jgi:hypothetical protein
MGDSMALDRFIVWIFLMLTPFIATPSLAGNDSNNPQHPLDAHLTKTDTGDLPHLMAERYVRVLITMNRTNFFLDGAKPRGFEYSLLREYEKFLNWRIKKSELPLKICKPNRRR